MGRGVSGLAAPVALAALTLGGSVAPAEGSPGPPPQAPLNVVVLTVDSFRADRLAAYGADEPRLPALDAWAAGAIVLPRAYAVSAWTFPGLISLFTGLLPAHHGYGARGERMRPVATLQSILASRGYRVPTLNHLTHVPGVSRLEVEPRWRPEGDDGPAGDLLQWLRSEQARAAPFLAWYHYRDLHLPYDVEPAVSVRAESPAPGLEQLRTMVVVPADTQMFGPDDREQVSRMYDAQLPALDDAWRQLWSTLQQTGLASRTVVVVTADHGEELLDHGLVGHASTTEHARLYEEIVRIPMIVRVPGHGPAPVDCNVSQVDLLPSLLPLLGIDPPAGLDGVDVFAPEGRARCADRDLIFESIRGGFQAGGPSARTYVQGIRRGSTKLIREVDRDGGRRQELYDLAADPQERRDLAVERPETVAGLAAVLDGWVESTGGLAARFADLEPAPPPRRRASQLDVPVQIVRPVAGQPLAYRRAGILEGVWTGSPTADYMVEYRVGAGVLYTEGSFATHGNVYRYGPVPVDVWNNLSQFNPWRVRVYPAGHPELASDWVQFRLLPEPADGSGPQREPAPRDQSKRSATTGSTPAARRAGR